MLWSSAAEMLLIIQRIRAYPAIIYRYSMETMNIIEIIVCLCMHLQNVRSYRFAAVISIHSQLNCLSFVFQIIG